MSWHSLSQVCKCPDTHSHKYVNVLTLTLTSTYFCLYVYTVTGNCSYSSDTSFCCIWSCFCNCLSLWGCLLLAVNLIKPVSISVCKYVHLSTKSFFDWNEICDGGKVMNDDMPYDPIHGEGHKTQEVWNSLIFKTWLLRHLQWTADY